MRLEGRHDEADEADERRHSGHLDRPGPEAVGREVLLGAARERVALGARQQRRQVLHHARVGVERRERLAILGPPLRAAAGARCG